MDVITLCVTILSPDGKVIKHARISVDMILILIMTLLDRYMHLKITGISSVCSTAYSG